MNGGCGGAGDMWRDSGYDVYIAVQQNSINVVQRITQLAVNKGSRMRRAEHAKQKHASC